MARNRNDEPMEQGAHFDRDPLIEKLTETVDALANLAIANGTDKTAIATIMQDREEAARIDREDKERQEKNRAWCAMTPKQRTQRAVDTQFPEGPGLQRFHVVLVEGQNVRDERGAIYQKMLPTPAWPDLMIWGFNQADAIAKYMTICGITNIVKDDKIKTDIAYSEPGCRLDLPVSRSVNRKTVPLRSLANSDQRAMAGIETFETSEV